MRGQVLGVDRNSGDGQISGEDGRRYRFRPEDWSDRSGPAVGAAVDFEVSDDRALSIYHIPAGVPATSTIAVAPSRPVVARTDRNKVVAALLAFFFGLLGIHRFYLGRTASGIVMLLLTCTVVGIVATGVWSLVDCVRYLAMSNGEFDHRYNVPPSA